MVARVRVAHLRRVLHEAALLDLDVGHALVDAVGLLAGNVVSVRFIGSGSVSELGRVQPTFVFEKPRRRSDL